MNIHDHLTQTLRRYAPHFRADPDTVRAVADGLAEIRPVGDIARAVQGLARDGHRIDLASILDRILTDRGHMPPSAGQAWGIVQSRGYRPGGCVPLDRVVEESGGQDMLRARGDRAEFGFRRDYQAAVEWWLREVRAAPNLTPLGGIDRGGVGSPEGGGVGAGSPGETRFGDGGWSIDQTEDGEQYHLVCRLWHRRCEPCSRETDGRSRQLEDYDRIAGGAAGAGESGGRTADLIGACRRVLAEKARPGSGETAAASPRVVYRPVAASADAVDLAADQVGGVWADPGIDEDGYDPQAAAPGA